MKVSVRFMLLLSAVFLLVLPFQNCSQHSFREGEQDSSSLEVDVPQEETSCQFQGKTLRSGETLTAYLKSAVPFSESCEYEVRQCRNGILSGSYQYDSCEVGVPEACLFDGKTVAHGQSVSAFLKSTVAFNAECESQERVCDNGTLSGSFEFSACKKNEKPTEPVKKSCLFNGVTLPHGGQVKTFASSSVAFGAQCKTQNRVCQDGLLTGNFEFASCSVEGPKSCLFNGKTIVHNTSVVTYKKSAVSFGASCDSVKEVRTCVNGVLSGSAAHASCEVGKPSACLFKGKTVLHSNSVTAYSSQQVPFGQSCSQKEERICNNGKLGGSYEFDSCGVAKPAACNFKGQSVAHGQTVNAYQVSSVAFGQKCSSEVRLCNNGVLTGSYSQTACSIAAAKSCTYEGKALAHGQQLQISGYKSSSANYPTLCEKSSMSVKCDNGKVTKGSAVHSTCVQKALTTSSKHNLCVDHHLYGAFKIEGGKLNYYVWGTNPQSTIVGWNCGYQQPKILFSIPVKDAPAVTMKAVVKGSSGCHSSTKTGLGYGQHYLTVCPDSGAGYLEFDFTVTMNANGKYVDASIPINRSCSLGSGRTIAHGTFFKDNFTTSTSRDSQYCVVKEYKCHNGLILNPDGGRPFGSKGTSPSNYKEKLCQ